MDSISSLKEKIAQLPAGSISTKTVNGKTYYYRRWSENKQRREKYIPFEELESVRAGIEQRKSLEAELKELSQKRTHDLHPSADAKHAHFKPEDFCTNVLTGLELHAFASSAEGMKRRFLFPELRDYLSMERTEKVFVLYGLRRTGKTTLIRQALLDMDENSFSQAAFMQILPSDTLAEVNKDLRRLANAGFRFVFIDEVTLMEDFIQGAALFSDVFVSRGMRIILSGTDSLGFLFSQDEQLYDRCVLLHTTFIPYREFESVLGVHGIDEYIRYGGTMSLGGVHYNETSLFANAASTNAYVDSAIARNIQHSLRCYQDGGHFRHLQGLHERDELTSAINRIVEDINHRFTIEVLTRDFRSSDLALSARNLRNDQNSPTDILDRIDIESVTRRLRDALDILNRPQQDEVIEEVHVSEIKEYLHLLDLIYDIDVVSLADLNRKTTRVAIAQPGLRYAQASALIESLLDDAAFAELSLEERNAVQNRILNEIMGRMLEEIVLLETKLAFPKKQVFTLQFPIGEFDMVVFDPQAASCEIFEIKHSSKAVSQQARHLVDAAKCQSTEHRFGPIRTKTVLYRGENAEIEGIAYKNVEEYLKELP